MNETIKILITGDFCPIYRVETLSLTGEHDKIFNDVLPIIKQSDIAVTNLECPLIDGGEDSNKFGPALKVPVRIIESLKYAGFDLVTLANNHIMDFGTPGLLSTIKTCSENGIACVGSGTNLLQARHIFYRTIKDKRLAFVNFAENEFSTTHGDEAGANPLNPITNFYDIQEARENADVVFVIVHGGHEHYPLPSPGVKERYRFFVEAGAHAVVGHHTHCFSGYEIYKDAPIFYSLGNFIFDNTLRRNALWNKGMAVIFELTGKTIATKIVGLVQCDKDIAGVRCMQKHEQEIFDQEIRRLSDILADDKALKESWKDMIERNKRVYQAMAFVGNGLIRKLINKKIIPLKGYTNHTRRNLLLNLFRCESHREIVIEALKLYS